MKKNVSKICVTIASLALTLSGSLVSTQAKTVKAPTIPRKVVVWVDTTSSKFKEAGSDKLAIKNASKSIKLKGNGEIDDNGPLFIPTTNTRYFDSPGARLTFEESAPQLLRLKFISLMFIQEKNSVMYLLQHLCVQVRL